MPITRMDHFNILTDDLPATLAFYEEHLNLKPGARPPFTFPGAWLYADGGKGKDPILHVVAALLLIAPELISSVVGLGLLGVVAAAQWPRRSIAAARPAA